MAPPWPWTTGGRKPGRSAIATSAVAWPKASAAGAQPEPITRATSWCSTPVALASADAASSALARLSVEGSSDIARSLVVGRDDSRSGGEDRSAVLQVGYGPDTEIAGGGSDQGDESGGQGQQELAAGTADGGLDGYGP